MHRKRHEIWALCALTATLLVFFSLISFSARDATIFSASSSLRPHDNWVGILGVHIAWLLLFLLGIGSYGLVFAGLWLSWRLFDDWPPKRGWLRAVGILLLILSGISFLALHKPDMTLFAQKIPTGGKTGQLLAQFLAAKLHPVGSHILLGGVFLIALLLSTPLTIGAIWDWLKRRGPLFAEKSRRAVSAMFAFFDGRDDADEKVEERPRKQKPPMAVQRPEPVTPPAIEPVAKKAPRKEPPAPSPALVPPGQYVLPSLDLLDTYEAGENKPDWKRLEQNAAILEEKLADFGVQGKVVAINPGPVITMYEYAPAPGIKISRIVGLSDDLSMALKAISIRVVAPIPGKAAIGIELPNPKRELVSIKAVLEAEAFSAAQGSLIIGLGKDTTGQPVATNLGKMPHLLIAGATGTGKSVCINTILGSLLYRNTPDDVRLVLIDPKRIELNRFEGIPHLVHPVVTDAKMATRALRWAVEEMELRYKLLADKNRRNIESYNQALAREKPPKPWPAEGATPEEELPHHRLPYIVVIIDELADLMMVASRDVEESITRLAQMARAAGIHLILATQRPSVDVLTGIIKANIPTRLSFQVSSRVDSRTVIDGSGAESLLGSGDMLFLPPGTAKLQRIHGAYISDNEVQRLVEHWKLQRLTDDPLKARVDFRDASGPDGIPEEEMDEKYDEAVGIVLETRQASISMLQRRLRVGYNRAARMIEIMEQQGIVGASDGVKPREVLGRRTF